LGLPRKLRCLCAAYLLDGVAAIFGALFEIALCLFF
jgi:hypothetical protein